MSNCNTSVFVFGLVVALCSCGGDETSAPSSSASSASSSGAQGSTSGGDGGAGGGAAGAGGAAGFVPMNGCDPETAEDLQEQSVEIQFPVNGLGYDPPCIIVHATHSVNFVSPDSNFVSHPLQGGTVDGGVATPDPESPIGHVVTGSSTSITFPEAGQFGYYCDYHYGSGMMGVIYVKEAPATM